MQTGSKCALALIAGALACVSLFAYCVGLPAEAVVSAGVSGIAGASALLG